MVLRVSKSGDNGVHSGYATATDGNVINGKSWRTEEDNNHQTFFLNDFINNIYFIA